jgi:hypothetical protein
VDSSFTLQNSKSSLFFFCACLHTYSMPTWQSIFYTERSAVLSPFVHSLHLLDALLAELYRTLNDSVFFFKLSAEFFLNAPPCILLNAHLAELSESSVILSLLNSQQSSSKLHLVPLLNAHLAELYRTPQILSATVSLIHSLASKVFNNLEVFLLSC